MKLLPVLPELKIGEYWLDTPGGILVVGIIALVVLGVGFAIYRSWKKDNTYKNR